MLRHLAHVISLVSLGILTACGGGSSPTRPTPTPPPTPISGTIAVSVVSATGARENTGVKFIVAIRFQETAGAAVTGGASFSFTLIQPNP